MYSVAARPSTYTLHGGQVILCTKISDFLGFCRVTSRLYTILLRITNLSLHLWERNNENEYFSSLAATATSKHSIHTYTHILHTYSCIGQPRCNSITFIASCLSINQSLSNSDPPSVKHRTYQIQFLFAMQVSTLLSTWCAHLKG